MTSSIMLRAFDVSKSYTNDEGASIDVLDHCSMEVEQGQIVAIMGSSGSGKSTLLHLLGGIDSPDSGSIYWDDTHITAISTKELDALRNRMMGFVFQFHHLLTDLSLQDNVSLPLIIGGYEQKSARQQASELLDDLGLGHRLSHVPKQCSGGEQQRAAIARAFVHQPSMILADEPTGNLDETTSKDVMDVLLSRAKQSQTTCVLVTHDAEIAKQCDRMYELQEGVLR
ncbi:MAG: ABC transporter ATP-binding protein [Balneolaceae bacterium]|nr:ABC transporter ATP-binding protein [Balneolaceae bacterium]MDR9446261.1 ABC transporter ATP-binding protein [Balneolaceae bacterium]